MKWLLCTALLALGVAGCGSDDGSTSSGPGSGGGGSGGTSNGGAGGSTSNGGGGAANTGGSGGGATTGGSSGGADTSWLIRVAAGSGFDHGAGLAAAPGGDFLAAGAVVGEPGELVHLGADDDPGRVELQSNGAAAMFLSRHDASGALKWAVTATSDVFADARGLAADATGAVVAGVFQGSLTFEAGKPGEVTLPAADYQDIFLARFDLEGALVWVRVIGGPGNEFVDAMTTLADGSMALVGYYEDGAHFGDASPVTLTSEQYDDAFVARYSAAGEFLWVRDAGGQGIDQALGVAATADGGVVVTGQFQEDLVFGRGTPDELTLLSAGSSDFFLARFDAAGALKWARRDGGKDETPGFGEVGNDVVELADGALLVTGEFEGPSTFGEGEPQETTLGTPDDWSSRKMFLARYSATGALEWARATGTGSGDGVFGWTIGEKLLPRPDGSFLVFGQFVETAIFGPGEPAEIELASAGGFDLVLSAYEANGDLLWARWAGGPEDQFAGAMLPVDDSLLLLGTVRESAQFALDPGQSPTFQSTGLSDVFAARLTP